MDDQILDAVCDLFDNETDLEAARLLNVPLAKVNSYLQDPRYLEDEVCVMSQFIGGLSAVGNETPVEDGGNDGASSKPIRLSQAAFKSVLAALNQATTEPKAKRARVKHVLDNDPKGEDGSESSDADSSRSLSWTRQRSADCVRTEADDSGKSFPRRAVSNTYTKGMDAANQVALPTDGDVLVLLDGGNIIAIEGGIIAKGVEWSPEHAEPANNENDGSIRAPETLGDRVVWRSDVNFFNKFCTKLSEVDFWLNFHVSRSTVEKMRYDMQVHYTSIEVAMRCKSRASSEYRRPRPRRPLISVILISLWILRTTESWDEITDRFRIRKGSVQVILSTFCKTLSLAYNHLISWPKVCELSDIKEGFLEMFGLPDVAGVVGVMSQFIRHNVVDTTYISGGVAPGENPSKFRRSVKQLVVCDHQMRIRSVHLNSPGGLNHAEVLAGTEIGAHLSSDPEQLLPGDAVLVAGRGFQLTGKIIRPLWDDRPTRHQDHKEPPMTGPLRQLQKRLIDANAVMFNCLGYLRSRWPRITWPRMRQISRVGETFIAACTLHNLAIQQEGDQALGGLTVVEPQPGVELPPEPCFTYDSDDGSRDRMAAALSDVVVSIKD